MSMSNDDSLLSQMGEATKAISAVTGLKETFVQQGWSEDNAEAMVVQLFRGANIDKEVALANQNRTQRRGR